MSKKILKNIISLIVFGIIMIIFSKGVDAAYLSVTPSATSGNAGDTITVTISSDCTGSVGISASNGTVSSSNEWIEGSVTVTVTLGSSGSTGITVAPNKDGGTMSDSTGKDITVSPASTSISINSVTPQPTSTENGSQNNSSSGAITNNADKTPEPVEEQKKSSNANLSNLGIKPNDFTGFKSWITSYNTTVPENVESVEVYATVSDSKSKVTGTGTKSLKKGDNALSVTVTAEDGTTKTYTINVTRKEEEDKNNIKDENKVEENKTANTTVTEKAEENIKDGLKELKIGGATLTPSFSTGVYEYKAKYIGEETKLDITTNATSEDYVVDVTGNKDLKEGENIITILVADKDGNNVATYQVVVDKHLIDEEAVAREQLEKEKSQRMMILVAIALGIIILGIIVFLIIRHRRNDDDYYDDDNIEENTELDDDQSILDKYVKEDDFDDDEYEEENYESSYEEVDYDDAEDIDELPKRKKHKGKRFK